MKIKFCGAAQYVTGSSHLITLDDGYKILLDCGLFQGNKRISWDKNNSWEFDPKEIDCVVLSHAHIDHCGRLPQLVKDGFNGYIYSTHASRSLANIMLMDSAKIQERDVEWYNKKLLKKRKKKNFLKDKRYPLYGQENVLPTIEKFVGYNYEQWFFINRNVEVMFREAGHILGSANVTLRITENGETKTIGFTGDIGRPDRPILRDPKPMVDVDYLIMESTYGDRLHELPPEQSEMFLDCIRRTCVEKQGKLIIPAFSVGRTQEIVYMMDQMESAGILPKIPVYVDSPLAVNATHIFGLHPECYDEDLIDYMQTDSDPFGFNSLNYIKSVQKSKQLNESKKACVIVSSSGMMNAGRIRHHMFNNIENPKNTFLIVGYCAPGTAGAILRDGAEELKIFGENKMVNADIEVMESFSAHADKNEMYDFVKNQKDNLKTLFLVHGEYQTQLKFKTFLGEKGFNNIEIPEQGWEVTL